MQQEAEFWTCECLTGRVLAEQAPNTVDPTVAVSGAFLATS